MPVFGSLVAEVTVAVLESSVLAATEAPTCTVKVKIPLPTGKEALSQETAPLAPTAGVVQDQPAGDDREMKVVPAGRESDRLTEAALLGPALVRVRV